MTERGELAHLLRASADAADAPADSTAIADLLRAANAAVLKTLTTIYRDPEMQDLGSRVVQLIQAKARGDSTGADRDITPVDLTALVRALAGAVDPPTSRHPMRRQYTCTWFSALLATVPATHPAAWRRPEVQDLASRFCKVVQARLANAVVEVSGHSEAG